MAEAKRGDPELDVKVERMLEEVLNFADEHWQNLNKQIGFDLQQKGLLLQAIGVQIVRVRETQVTARPGGRRRKATRR